MVVERLLASEGLARRARARGVRRARLAVAARDGDDDHGQYLRLGASLDFRRERFTMDEGYARAVTKVFVDLYARATSSATTA